MGKTETMTTAFIKEVNSVVSKEENLNQSPGSYLGYMAKAVGNNFNDVSI